MVHSSSPSQDLDLDSTFDRILEDHSFRRRQEAWVGAQEQALVALVHDLRRQQIEAQLNRASSDTTSSRSRSPPLAWVAPPPAAEP